MLKTSPCRSRTGKLSLHEGIDNSVLSAHSAHCSGEASPGSVDVSSYRSPRRTRPGYNGDGHCCQDERSADGPVLDFRYMNTGCNRKSGNKNLELRHRYLKYVELARKVEDFQSPFDGWHSLEG